MGTVTPAGGVKNLDDMVHRANSRMGSGRQVGGPGDRREGNILHMLFGYVKEYGTSYEEGREIIRVGQKINADLFHIL